MKTQQAPEPFFARFLETPARKGDDAMMTTLKAGKCGNDCDTDSDVVPPTQQRPMQSTPAAKEQTAVQPKEPIMTTMKAGNCGNDCDTDVGLRPGEFLA